MSKAIKTVASIALPIVGSLVGGPIGGAIGGAIGGGINGGIPGAVLGAAGGYASSGLVGNVAGTPLETVTGQAGLYGPTQGSGVLGAVTGGGIRALAPSISTSSSIIGGLSSIGNQLLTQENANAAKKAAQLQSASIDKALITQQPYQNLGSDAVTQIQQIQDDPTGYIKNNELYNSLANDAERRLLANQAAKGKVGSGGTAAALQDQLLQIGNGLVNQKINTLQQQATIGQGSANNAANLITGQGAVNAAGVVGQSNAYTKGYDNQINTLLALQNLGRPVVYAPYQQLSR